MHSGKVFRDPSAPLYQLDMFPPTLRDYIPENEVTRMVDEIIDELDLTVVESQYSGGGAPAYHPRMMIKLFVLACRLGMPSSRRIADACRFDTRFMYLARKNTPDHRTICLFRRRHEKTIKSVFVETVRICVELNLANLEDVSVDGTKLEANASSKSTYNAARCKKDTAALTAYIEKQLEEAERLDAEEDASHGHLNADDLPPSLADRDERKRQIKKAIETARSKQARYDKAQAIMKETGGTTACITDTESRVMKTRSGNKSAYNAHAVVDAKCHVILAANVSQDVNDFQQFGTMLEQVVDNTGRMPDRVAADVGFNSPETFEYIEQKKVDAYIPLRPEQISLRDYEYDAEQDVLRGCSERTQGHLLIYHKNAVRDGNTYRVYRDANVGKHGTERWFKTDVATRFVRLDKMHRKMRTAKGRATYRKRQHTVEPVFGHIKGPFSTRRLLLLGLGGAKIQFLLACCCHNIGKIVSSKSPTRPQRAKKPLKVDKMHQIRSLLGTLTAHRRLVLQSMAATSEQRIFRRQSTEFSKSS